MAFSFRGSAPSRERPPRKGRALTRLDQLSLFPPPVFSPYSQPQPCITTTPAMSYTRALGPLQQVLDYGSVTGDPAPMPTPTPSMAQPYMTPASQFAQLDYGNSGYSMKGMNVNRSGAVFPPQPQSEVLYPCEPSRKPPFEDGTQRHGPAIYGVIKIRNVSQPVTIKH